MLDCFFWQTNFIFQNYIGVSNELNIKAYICTEKREKKSRYICLKSNFFIFFKLLFIDIYLFINKKRNKYKSNQKKEEKNYFLL